MKKNIILNISIWGTMILLMWGLVYVISLMPWQLTLSIAIILYVWFKIQTRNM